MENRFPRVEPLGLDGLIVRFADRLDDLANRAALAFLARLDTADGLEIIEASSSLVSVYVRFDPLAVSADTMQGALSRLVSERDWFQADPPAKRRLVQIPTCYASDVAPQIREVAALVGRSEAEAVAELASARVRVTTIGFAPGQPYLGTLPAHWDIPRQTSLTPQVPRGALIVAIRQLVLFTNPAPTGWRHVGQTAVSLFSPDSDTPFLLRAGDEVMFPAISLDELTALQGTPTGGARLEPLG